MLMTKNIKFLKHPPISRYFYFTTGILLFRHYVISINNKRQLQVATKC
jgi:hypothetical protein